MSNELVAKNLRAIEALIPTWIEPYTDDMLTNYDEQYLIDRFSTMYMARAAFISGFDFTGSEIIDTEDVEVVDWGSISSSIKTASECLCSTWGWSDDLYGDNFRIEVFTNLTADTFFGWTVIVD